MQKSVSQNNSFENFWVSHENEFKLMDIENGPIIKFKGVLHLLPKISMFCTLSQNNQQRFKE